MVEGLYTAAAGMAAQQVKLEAIGNDVANVSTPGYKAERVAFSDLLYSPLNIAGTSTQSGAGASAGLLGRAGGEGAIRETGNPLDLAIEGEGYFQVRLPGGQTALTRSGAFTVDATGTITDAAGDQLLPPIKLPVGVQPSALSVAPDGTVTAQGRKLGQIGIVTVPAPDHLLAAGSGQFTATAASGEPRAASGATVRQGALEQSDVDLGREMTDMMSTQRSFQLASSAVQTESQMMSIANQMRA